MTNREWLNSLSDEELAKWLDKTANCTVCVNHVAGESSCPMSDCVGGISRWLKQKHTEPMPKIQIGDVLEVVLKGGNWYDGICVAKGIVYIMGECICKEITEVKIKAISRWSSGSMQEIWRADNANK